MAKDNPASPTPRQWGTVSPREALRRRFFPDVTLVTHEGKKVRLFEDLVKDKCVMMNFMYARCTGICSPVTANLRRAQMLLKDHIGRDMFMYSFTLKPKEDSPEALKEYVKEHKLGPGWTFLTGHPDDMERVRVQLGFNDSDPKRDADVTNHTGIVRYGNEALMLWAAFPGLQLPQAIARSMMWVAAPGKADPKFLRRE